jgi:hypothetical protein
MVALPRAYAPTSIALRVGVHKPSLLDEAVVLKEGRYFLLHTISGFYISWGKSPLPKSEVHKAARRYH